jgi:tetratricopeptide (TPR) repeat protein
LDDMIDPSHDERAEVRIEALRALTAADPEDSPSWFLLGRELAVAGRHGEAAEAFRMATVANPDYTAAYRQRGNALEADGRYEEAADVYGRGIEVAERMRDLQTGKEMAAFLKRLARDRGITG